jgi:hypothetical protein
LALRSHLLQTDADGNEVDEDVANAGDIGGAGEYAVQPIMKKKSMQERLDAFDRQNRWSLSTKSLG